MFLKSLTMKGFKSFADPTVLELEPGITVVVGPNGSGKSNVVDAVTWVLGAQGPRSLRSQKMEDVIFAGTSSRPALGRAEVSLTIDNASGRLPVDMAEVTITRILFRSGESEYAINGMPCRLLDVQELLADSGVGRQQHMIIGQGQLDGVLSARPEDRRTVIEEAAGVLKHRRRRERAERRLAATQENLERLGDLVREVRRQIRPLERQAAATRQHAQLTEELRSVRLYLTGQELATLAARHGRAATELATLAEQEQAVRDALAELDHEAQTTTAELSSRRQDDLADALGRVQGLTERARGLSGVLTERARALAAALDAAADVDVVSTLEADAARLEEDRAEAEQAAGAVAPELDAVVAEESAARETESVLRAHLDQEPDPAERTRSAAAARERAALLGRSVQQHADALAEFQRRVDALDERSAGRRSTREDLATRLAQVRSSQPTLADAATAAAAAEDAAQEALERAEQEAARAAELRHRAAARADALAKALADLEGSAGSGALAGVPGVAGALADLVDVDPGWEPAFDAAGPPAAAVVVEGPQAARTVLERLQSSGAGGSVLATEATAAGAGPAGFPTPLPAGAELVRVHVRPRPDAPVPGLAALLDRLLGDAVCVPDWRAAVDLALAQPGRVVVTRAGDRFSARGWRVRSGSPVVTRGTVARAAEEAASASVAAEAAEAALRTARERAGAARRGAQEATRALEQDQALVARLEGEIARATQDLEQDQAERDDARRALDQAEQRRTAAHEELAALEASLPELEAAAAHATERAATRRAELEEAVARRRALSEQRHSLEVAAAGAEERRRVLATRLAEVERRLAGHAEERAEAAARRHRLEADVAAVERLQGVVTGVRTRLDTLLGAVRSAYRDQVEAVRAGGERLEQLRQRRTQAEQRVEELAARHHQLDMESSEVSIRAQSVADTVRRELDSEPEDAAAAPCPPLPEGTSAEEHATVLAERLAAVGPVNPLALDELSVLEERHQELAGQVEDVQSARRELHQVIRHLDEEIIQTFAAAMADVNEHFSSLVATLFPGGTGRLELTAPDDLLHTGVEVEVRPLGRNVRRVSLLSGGERSLVALAFLFAVFRSRPSPFYLMDEVEAALDDVNLHRFLDLVHEFREEAQLIIVSHQKRTMETGDALYGVTMAPGGSSQVVSQKVDRAESEPDSAAPLGEPPAATPPGGSSTGEPAPATS